jgi:hypothetical protein
VAISAAAASGLVLGGTVRPASAIFNGSPDGTSHPAVGIVYAQDQFGNLSFCSGELVHSEVYGEVLVTAAHCQEGFGTTPGAPVSVSFDPSPFTNPSATVFSSSFYADPNFDPSSASDIHDVAVVVFSPKQKPKHIQALPLAPIGSVDSLSVGPPSVGAPVTVVGYGLTGPGDFAGGVRTTGTMSLASVNPTVVTEDPNPGGTCQGDSGGAHIVTIAGKLYLAAITHSGGDTCGGGGDTSYRVDTAEVQSFVNAPFPAAPDAQPIPTLGKTPVPVP